MMEVNFVDLFGKLVLQGFKQKTPKQLLIH